MKSMYSNDIPLYMILITHLFSPFVVFIRWTFKTVIIKPLTKRILTRFNYVYDIVVDANFDKKTKKTRKKERQFTYTTYIVLTILLGKSISKMAFNHCFNIIFYSLLINNTKIISLTLYLNYRIVNVHIW